MATKGAISYRPGVGRKQDHHLTHVLRAYLSPICELKLRSGLPQNWLVSPARSGALYSERRPSWPPMTQVVEPRHQSAQGLHRLMPPDPHRLDLLTTEVDDIQ